MMEIVKGGGGYEVNIGLDGGGRMKREEGRRLNIEGGP